MSLKGSEILVGGIIIIFRVISILVIIRLIIKNGINMVKLIWKVVFSLLVIYVGNRMCKGIIFGFFSGGRLVKWVYSVRLDLWVWCNINLCSGCEFLFIVIFIFILFWLKGR